MYLIEPCCAQKDLRGLRDAIARGGTKLFTGCGDLSLTELLPALLNRYCQTDMIIAAPSIPDQAAEVIEKCMRKQRARMDGKGNLDVVSHLTIIASLSRRKSPKASSWRRDNPFVDRLTLVSRQTDDTAILLPDFAIIGPVNMRYGKNFIATATTEADRVAGLWKEYTALTDATEDAPEEQEMTEAAVEPTEQSEAPQTDIEEPVKEESDK